MKRFFVTTILTAVIAGVLTYFMPRNFEFYLGRFSPDATVAIYCRQTTLDGVDMGNSFKVECGASAFYDTVSECSGVDGISVRFNGTFDDVAKICKFFRLQIASVYEQEGLYIVCGKSNKIRNGVIDGNKFVNLQIAYHDGVIHLGSPLILGDY